MPAAGTITRVKSSSTVSGPTDGLETLEKHSTTRIPQSTKSRHKTEGAARKKSITLNKARPVPDFSKLHKKWENKFNEAKSNAKKPCTVPLAFELNSKVKLPTDVKQNRPTVNQSTSKKEHILKKVPAVKPGNDEFVEDLESLKCIFNGKGISSTHTTSRRTTQSAITVPRGTLAGRMSIYCKPPPNNSQQTLDAQGLAALIIADRETSQRPSTPQQCRTPLRTIGNVLPGARTPQSNKALRPKTPHSIYQTSTKKPVSNVRDMIRDCYGATPGRPDQTPASKETWAEALSKRSSHNDPLKKTLDLDFEDDCDETSHVLNESAVLAKIEEAERRIEAELRIMQQADRDPEVVELLNNGSPKLTTSANLTNLLSDLNLAEAQHNHSLTSGGVTNQQHEAPHLSAVETQIDTSEPLADLAEIRPPTPVLPILSPLETISKATAEISSPSIVSDSQVVYHTAKFDIGDDQTLQCQTPTGAVSLVRDLTPVITGITRLSPTQYFESSANTPVLSSHSPVIELNEPEQVMDIDFDSVKQGHTQDSSSSVPFDVAKPTMNVLSARMLVPDDIWKALSDSPVKSQNETVDGLTQTIQKLDKQIRRTQRRSVALSKSTNERGNPSDILAELEKINQQQAELTKASEELKSKLALIQHQDDEQSVTIVAEHPDCTVLSTDDIISFHMPRPSICGKGDLMAMSTGRSQIKPRESINLMAFSPTLQNIRELNSFESGDSVPTVQNNYPDTVKPQAIEQDAVKNTAAARAIEDILSVSHNVPLDASVILPSAADFPCTVTSSMDSMSSQADSVETVLDACESLQLIVSSSSKIEVSTPGQTNAPGALFTSPNIDTDEPMSPAASDSNIQVKTGAFPVISDSICSLPPPPTGFRDVLTELPLVSVLGQMQGSYLMATPPHTRASFSPGSLRLQSKLISSIDGVTTDCDSKKNIKLLEQLGKDRTPLAKHLLNSSQKPTDTVATPVARKVGSTITIWSPVLSSTIDQHLDDNSNKITPEQHCETIPETVSEKMRTPAFIRSFIAKRSTVKKTTRTDTPVYDGMFRSSQRYKDALLDEEVAIFMCRAFALKGKGRHLLDPLANSLCHGDEQHFIPISFEEENMATAAVNGSAFHCFTP